MPALYLDNRKKISINVEQRRSGRDHLTGTRIPRTHLSS